MLNEMRGQYTNYQFRQHPPGLRAQEDLFDTSPARFAPLTRTFVFPSLIWGTNANKRVRRHRIHGRTIRAVVAARARQPGRDVLRLLRAVRPVGAVAHRLGFRIDMLRLVRYIRAELMIVVGTRSSESVFPRLHAKLRQLGVDPPVVALVLPAGYAFNHDGTCLYFSTVAVFLAQAVGIDLSIGQQLGLLAILLATSKGGAGVAGSAIVVLASTLAATGTIPVASVGLILGVHRLLSSAFVPVNVLGNAIATLVIARMEQALDVPTFESELRRPIGADVPVDGVELEPGRHNERPTPVVS